MRTYTCDPELDVSGITTLSFVDNLGSDTFLPLAEKHGLKDINTEDWYGVQKVFDLFNDIVQNQGGSTQTFVAMGMKIAEQSTFPPELAGKITLPMILEGWQEHYAANHRNGTFPPTQTQKISDTHYQIILDKDHIYPYDLVYGMAYGFARLLLPPKTAFKVSYVPDHSPYEEFEDYVAVDIRWGDSI